MSDASLDTFHDEPDHATAIAVIGLAGRFPGAASLPELWRHLCAGDELIQRFSDEDLRAAGVDEPLIADPHYVRAGAVLPDHDRFDAAFFGFSPREAELLDPQQRLLLETAWEALDGAGYSDRQPASRSGRASIGVFAGSGMNHYLLSHLHPNAALHRGVGAYAMFLVNNPDSVAPRLSYKLDLRGPSVTVQTACSTSLVAVHMACQSLLAGECDMALAGGASLLLPHGQGYLHQEGMILSPDGHCRAFAADAAGTLGGSGVGLVLLKPLADALADGDTVHAVIRGSAINNDGAGKISFTAPSVDGQARVIREALAVAGVEPDSIGYVEAHGTGTPLGDPIEVAALTEAFRSDRRDHCALGSIKTSIGHADAAAGVAGLIKTVLALQHRLIPPSLHARPLNPMLKLEDSPFFVPYRALPWPQGRTPRRAGVSSFGVGGTNAHVVLEEAPACEPDMTSSSPSTSARPPHLLLLSARSEDGLTDLAGRLAAHLAEQPRLDLADVARSLVDGRQAHPVRGALLCRDTADAVQQLARAAGDGSLTPTLASPTPRPVVFMFPGQGGQTVDMGRDLYESEPVFHAEIDRCAELLRPHVGDDLRELLYPGPAQRAVAEARIHQFGVAQPALFAVSWAMAQLWLSWGVKPRALIGHSIGEYVAATVAGVMSLPEALELVALRGRLMERQPEGAMLAVSLPAAEIDLPPDLALAAVNAPTMSVASGTPQAVEAFAQRLAAREVPHRRLHVTRAGHSALMEPVLAPLVERLGALRLKAPRIPYVSNLTGTWITDAEATDPRYWARHTRETVQFSPGLATLAREPDLVLLEVGPGRSLGAFARQHPALAAALVLRSAPQPQEDVSGRACLLEALGQLWSGGGVVDWPAFFGPARRRHVALPSCRFERERCWIERPAPGALEGAGSGQPARRPQSDWLHVPGWERQPSVPPRVAAEVSGSVLVLGEAEGLGGRLAATLDRCGVAVLQAPLASEATWRALMRTWQASGTMPRQVLHLGGLVASSGNALQQGFHSLLALARVLGEQPEPVRLTVLARELQPVIGTEALDPERTALLGAVRVIPQEYPHLACRCIDLDGAALGAPDVVDRVLNELVDPVPSVPMPALVAWRGRHGWTPTFARVTLPASAGPIREGGVYLITGGLGGIGLILAEHLARWRPKLVLLGRSALPARADWSRWLAEHPQDDPVSGRLRRLIALEQAGVALQLPSADVADERRMEAVLADAVAAFGPIDGVFHGAGITREQGSGCFIPNADAQACEPHFRAKLDGARVLDRLLSRQARHLDFCVAFSSLAAVLGGLGFAAYSAANVALDCFAAERRQAGGLPWTSLNWDGWRLDDTPQPGDAGPGSTILGYAITPDEGMAVLQAVLTGPPHEQILVSTGDLSARLAQWRQPVPAADDSATTSAPGTAGVAVGNRPSRKPPVAPRDPVETGVIEIWQSLLGVPDIGIDDDFWALGGHSLLATQVIAHVRRRFSVALSMKAVFEAPTVAGLAATIGRLQRADAPGMPLAESGSLQPMPRGPETRVPLSFAQQRLWFLSQLEDHPGQYNIPVAMHLRGRLDVAALEQALRIIESRHEPLRTRFPESGGEPWQQILPPSLRLPLTDLSHETEAAWQTGLRRHVQHQAEAGFDLVEGPLWRATLLRRATDHHVLTMTLHHTVADGWSMGILMHELATLYDALSGGADAAAARARLPALPVQYADYALWQRGWLQGMVLDEQIAWWRQRLDGAPPLLMLPTDHPRPALQRGVGDKLIFLLPTALVEALKQVGREEGATLFMVVHTVFALLLSRWSGQDDILIGTPNANRQFTETEPLIGLFLNALVLRADVSGNPSLRALLARVREADLEAFQRHALPFETLVEALRPERSLAYSPVFQVMFNLLNNRFHVLELAGLTVENAAIESKVAKHDLTLVMHELDSGLHAVFEYDTDLFERSTIERLAGHFRTLLEAAVADPDRPVRELPMLTAAEHAQLLVQWNDNATADAGDTDYATRFEAQAAATPDRIAVRWQPEPGGALASLTFAALDQRANQLAQALQTRSVGGEVGREDIVGVCLDRSADTLVAMLALFKVGAVYMPLDPALPDERLALLVRQARVPLVLTRASLAERLARVMPDTPLLCPDRDAIALQDLPAQPPAGVQRDPARLAYVLFTSGSTGLPKGVMIEHRGLVNNLRAKIRDHGLGLHDTLAQTAPPGFDISVWQFLAAPWIGATVRIFGDEIAKDPALLLRHVEDERITVLEVVPSLLRFMLDEVDAARAAGEAVPTLAALRWLSLTGEALPPTLCTAWFGRYPRIPVLNAYGPAECSDDATHHILRGPLPPGADTVPIGRALPNVRLYVLDEHLQPLPVGVAGELCIGGIGVGRGYLHDPERTQAVFRPDPWADRPDARLYRTGDRARWRADGTLEFLGRLDFQVKLRGLRIELGEIEAALERHPAVRQSVVVVHVDTHGEPQLVAHVAIDPGEPASEAELGAHLARRLPAYMVPARLLRHEALPLTPNGKIDRRRLPAPYPQDTAGMDAFVAPATPTEQQLAGIWQEVLRLERIGRHDHFFALGGHSLLATQVVSRLRRQLDIELPLRSVFAAPTLAGLAEQIDQLRLVQQVRQGSGASVSPNDAANDEREEILI